MGCSSSSPMRDEEMNLTVSRVERAKRGYLKNCREHEEEVYRELDKLVDNALEHNNKNEVVTIFRDKFPTTVNGIKRFAKDHRDFKIKYQRVKEGSDNLFYDDNNGDHYWVQIKLF